MTTRRRGRPPLIEGELALPASTNLPPDVHDEICRLALKYGVSVSRVLRHAAIRLVKAAKDEQGAAVRL